jgi:mannose-6-phosphate isomerase-like protein (cupin superfamily)
MLQVGGTTAIPPGATHRIANHGTVDPEFIHVRLGALPAEGRAAE